VTSAHPAALAAGSTSGTFGGTSSGRFVRRVRRELGELLRVMFVFVAEHVVVVRRPRSIQSGEAVRARY
jgi:hypothetical protein